MAGFVPYLPASLQGSIVHQSPKVYLLGWPIVTRLRGLVGVGAMESNNSGHTHENEKLHENNIDFSNKLQWAEFTLKERIIKRLLFLLTVATLFVLIVVGFIVWKDKDISIAIVGALITGTVGYLGKLLYNATKRYVEEKK